MNARSMGRGEQLSQLSLTPEQAAQAGMVQLSTTVFGREALASMADDLRSGGIAFAYVDRGRGYWELWREGRGMVDGKMFAAHAADPGETPWDGFHHLRLPKPVLQAFRAFLLEHGFVRGQHMAPSAFFAEVADRQWARIKGNPVPTVATQAQEWANISVADDHLDMIDAVCGPGKFYESRVVYLADVGAGNWRRKGAAA